MEADRESEEQVRFWKEEAAGAEETARAYARERDTLAGELDRVAAQLRDARTELVAANDRAQRSAEQLQAMSVDKLNLDVQLQQALDRLATRRGDVQSLLSSLELRAGGRTASVDVT